MATSAAATAALVLRGMGVGTCSISKGGVSRGATSGAGEGGPTTMVVGGRTCRCGAEGCLEAYVGAGAIVARYEQLKGRRVTTSPGELEARIAAIIDARDRDRAPAQFLHQTVTYPGPRIADLHTLCIPH